MGAARRLAKNLYSTYFIMKKLLLTLALAAGVASFSQAQGIKLGAKAGLNLSSLSGEDADGLESKIGLHFGGTANFGLSDMLSVQPELLFSMKGARFEEDNDFRYNFTYLDVPVLLKVNAGNLFFEAGPQIGFLLSAKSKGDDDSNDIKDDLKTIDVGYAAGLGYQLDGGFNLGLRYNGGLSKVSEGSDDDLAEIRNSVFQLYVGYQFGGK